jgi:hypothetical protein
MASEAKAGGEGAAHWWAAVARAEKAMAGTWGRERAEMEAEAAAVCLKAITGAPRPPQGHVQCAAGLECCASASCGSCEQCAGCCADSHCGSHDPDSDCHCADAHDPGDSDDD